LGLRSSGHWRCVAAGRPLGQVGSGLVRKPLKEHVTLDELKIIGIEPELK